MVREHKKVLAVNFLIYFLVRLVLHVIRILRRDTINNNLLVELDSQSILVNGNFLNVVSASDFHSGLCDEVLYDDVRHQFSVCVPLLVEAMNLIHLYLVELELAVISSCKYGFVHRVD